MGGSRQYALIADLFSNNIQTSNHIFEPTICQTCGVGSTATRNTDKERGNRKGWESDPRTGSVRGNSVQRKSETIDKGQHSPTTYHTLMV